MSSTQITEFNERLKKRLREPPPTVLNQLLTTGEYQSILSYVIENESLYNDLACGKALAIKKDKFNRLPRSISILRTVSGEFQLFVDTKSKLAGGVKRDKKTIFRGIHKIGKIAWRIDSEEPQKFLGFRGLMTKGLEARLEQADCELNAAQLDSSKCTITIDGGQYLHEKHEVKKIYSPFAELGDLYDFLEANPDLSETAIYQLKVSLLESLNECHQNGIIHDDIGLANILVFEHDGKLVAKLCDFGNSMKEGSMKKRYTTTAQDYASPETRAAYSKPDAYPETERAVVRAYNAIYHRSKIGSFFASKYDALAEAMNDVQLVDLSTPNKANDVWSVGIAFCEMDGFIPDAEMDVKELPELTQLMLDPNRESRITAEEALIKLKQQAASTSQYKP